MHVTSSKLYEYFKNKVFFVRVMLPQDTGTIQEAPFPVMEIISSSDNLKIENSQILPRMVIIDRSGEIIADLEGQYPLIYFYGILSEL